MGIFWHQYSKLVYTCQNSSTTLKDCRQPFLVFNLESRVWYDEKMEAHHYYLNVAVHSPLWQTFDYLAPKDSLCPPAIGMRVLVPFGRRELVGILLDIKTASLVPPNKIKPAIKYLDSVSQLPSSIIELCLWVSQYYHYPVGSVFHQALPKLLREDKPLPQLHEESLIITDMGVTALTQNKIRSLNQKNCLILLNEQKLGLPLSLLKQAGISQAILKTLLEKKWITIQENKKEISFSNLIKEKNFFSEFSLNPEQQNAVTTINSCNHFKTFVLEGITGSGKTEVYFQCIFQQLCQNKQALVLVPEISLTPQTVSRFKKRFNVPIIVLHSGLNDRERTVGWLQACQGNAAIIIGTRSTIFTPLLKPGIIILDEEHDSSFKQQSGLKYSARDCAVIRARLENIPLILGSATLSLETLHNCNRGRYQHLILNQRAGNATPPSIGLIDLRLQKLNGGLSSPLITKIQQHLNNQGQVMLFLNRRGFAPVFFCTKCGWCAECIYCDARLTLHLSLQKLFCHHCGAFKKLPKTCEKCKSDKLVDVGLGTERIEKKIHDLFPAYSCIRVDRDTTRRKHAIKKMFDQIHEKTAAILIGTQMLAKGHHFPNLTLVAIIDADAGFFSSDFRALERMGQLLIQVSGRAGRGDKKGEVLIQTYQPNHPFLKLLLDHGYNRFAQALLKERQQSKFPPFYYFALIKCEAKIRENAFAFLNEVKFLLKKNSDSTIEILGPIPAMMEKKAKKYHSQLLLQSSDRNQLHELIRSNIQKFKNSDLINKVKWTMDIDPLEI